MSYLPEELHRYGYPKTADFICCSDYQDPASKDHVIYMLRDAIEELFKCADIMIENLNGKKAEKRQ